MYQVPRFELMHPDLSSFKKKKIAVPFHDRGTYCVNILKATTPLSTYSFHIRPLRMHRNQSRVTPQRTPPFHAVQVRGLRGLCYRPCV